MFIDNLHPTISTIIPCRNEEAFIERCLDSLLANDYPIGRLEIIVVDGLSQDRTRTILARYAMRYSHVRILDNPEGTIPAAMNVGIRQSSGEVVMKVDAHSSYPPNYISECVRHLLTAHADMAGGVCLITPRTTTLTAGAIAAALSHWFASGNAYVKTGSGEMRWADAAAFGCWRRDIFDKVGLFDESLIRNSDMDHNKRLRAIGGRILLVPNIKISYYADGDLLSFCRHNFKDGMWTTYSLKHGKHASSLRHWIPLVSILSLFMLSTAVLFSPLSRRIAAGIGIVYLIASLAAAIQLCMKTGTWAYLPLVPIVFAVRHLSHGIGALYGLLLAALPGATWRGRRAGGAEGGYPARRGLDVIGSLTGLCLCFPLFILIGLLIKLDSPGPILYRDDRVGKSGKPFKMIKFRTMRVAAEDHGAAPITPGGDPRITFIGRFLRKYKLDELPQLFNVLKGEMSLVGPRPEAPFYFQYYDEEEKRIIQSVRPGMTDYGSLRFHDEERLLADAVDPVKVYVEQIRAHKVREQLRYIREQSFLTDLRIIFRTISVILTTRLSRNGGGVPDNSSGG